MNNEIALKILNGQEQILSEIGEMKQRLGVVEQKVEGIEELKAGQAELKQKVANLETAVKKLERGQDEIISEVASTTNMICQHIDKRLAKVYA